MFFLERLYLEQLEEEISFEATGFTFQKEIATAKRRFSRKTKRKCSAIIQSIIPHKRFNYLTNNIKINKWNLFSPS